MLEGLRGEVSVAELCRREGIAESLNYKWAKDCLEAGKACLAGDTQRQVTSSEVSDLRAENEQLKMKSIVKLDTFYFPWELDQAIASFVDYYNHHRYHESLDNLTPADVFSGRREEILRQRQAIKQHTLMQRRQVYLSGSLYTV